MLRQAPINASSTATISGTLRARNRTGARGCTPLAAIRLSTSLASRRTSAQRCQCPSNRIAGPSSERERTSPASFCRVLITLHCPSRLAARPDFVAEVADHVHLDERGHQLARFGEDVALAIGAAIACMQAAVGD